MKKGDELFFKKMIYFYEMSHERLGLNNIYVRLF